MFGGVADKYRLYKQIGEPFKDGKALYVMVQAPFGKSEPIKVRFYTDKAHAATKVDPYVKPLWHLYGFKSENDSIQIIRDKDLSQEEQMDLFYFNWQKGGRWQGVDLYGGAWCAPSDEPVPPIAHPEKVFKCDWRTFKTKMRQACLIKGLPKDTCPWLKED